MDLPRLSVILLTWNEERNVGACLSSLTRQTSRDFEVVVVDAASTDATVPLVRAAQAWFPVPLRLETSARRLPIGEARNLGVALARAPRVAFLSADAEAAPDWAERILAALERADAVFGRQVHDPHRWTVGAAVRGLRYHHPDAPVDDPLPYASNVSAGYRTDLLRAFPFDPAVRASEDVLLAARATAAGHCVAYDPGIVVRHHDVAGAREELRKCLREGAAGGRDARERGVDRPLLAWAGLLLVAAAATAARPRAGAWLLPLALWAPALRRALRRRRAMPAPALLLGGAASPPFDLAYLGAYLRGLTRRRAPPRKRPALPPRPPGPSGLQGPSPPTLPPLPRPIQE